MARSISELENQLEAFTLGNLPLHRLLAEFEAAITEDGGNGQLIAALLTRYLNQGEITITAYKQITSEISLPDPAAGSASDGTQTNTVVGDTQSSPEDELVGELEETVFAGQDSGQPGSDTNDSEEASIDLSDFTAQPSGGIEEGSDDEATQLALDDDATEVVAETSGSPSSWPAGVSQGTGSSWSDPSSWVDSGEPLGVGSVIKERFELVQQLGVGGMGIVYKALDRRKVEAQDRDPYVAVKILNDEFKKHPKALQALQREARKTQELAHPNIMTVYDFDRVGSDVYMTMEFLDGEPMDVVIKKRKGKPFPEDEAMVMIEGMCEALGYAHRRNLVHSDFKPGNVFLTSNGTIKVLDFGIASRVTSPNTDSEDDGADKTVFDVKQFGAFTPAYATCEIMEGAEPDPRDDIYALGCVSYQLLGGKHPFNRKRATFARDNGLVPEPIPTLTRRQQKTLNKSLSFSHEECMSTVDEFIDGVRRRKSRLVPITLALAAVVVVAALALRTTITGYLQQQEHDRILALIESGEKQQVMSGLDELHLTEDPLRSALLADGREAILTYYENQTGILIDDSQGTYDFPQASRLVDDARVLYPDSAQIERMLDTIDSRRSRLLNQLTSRFNNALEEGSLLTDPEADDINEVLELVKQIEPNHPLLNDPRLPPAYVANAEEALAASNFSLASSFAAAGLDYFPDNLSLINLRDEVTAAQKQEASRIRVAELAKQIEAAAPPTSIQGYDAIRPNLLEIQQLDQQNPTLIEYQQAFQDFVPGAINQLLENKQWDEANRLLTEYGDLLPSALIISQQQSLLTQSRAYDRRVETLLATFESSFGDTPPSDENLRSASQSLSQLSAYAVNDDVNLSYARNRVGYGYLTLARQARAAGQTDNSETYAQLGLNSNPTGLIAEALQSEASIASGADIPGQNIDVAELIQRFESQSDQLTAHQEASSLLGLLDRIALAKPIDTIVQSGRRTIAEQLATQVDTLIAEGAWNEATDLSANARVMIPEIAVVNTLPTRVSSAASKRKSHSSSSRSTPSPLR